MPLPIKVLHVIDSLAPGGAERVMVELVNRLDRNVVMPSVCITRSDTTLVATIRDGTPIFQLGRNNTWDRRALCYFGKIVRDEGIDILHVHGYSSTRLVAAAKVYNRLSIPIILHAHSCYPPGLVTGLAARTTVKHFIGVSSELVSWAQSLMRFPIQRTTLLGNALNMANYLDNSPIELRDYFAQRPRFVGIVLANVLPVKDFDTLFGALARSSYRGDVGIVIAGSVADLSYVEHCRQVLTDLNLTDSVAFLGSRLNVQELLASADFAMLSSANESGPMALLEYMAAGLPFVVTRVGQIGEAVGSAGLRSVVPRCDPTSMAQALDRTLGQPNVERRQQGLVGREFVERNFSIDDRIQRLQNIYRSLMDSDGHQR